MSLVFDGDGENNIAYTVGGKMGGEILSASDDAEEGYEAVDLSSGHFEICPRTDTRELYYIAASNGAGKSTLAAEIATNYHRLFEDCPIYLLSRVPDDKAFNKLEKAKIVKRIIIDEDFAETPLDILQDIQGGAMVIFDDCDTFTDKNIVKRIDDFRLQLLELGRHNKIFGIFCSHLINGTNRNFTRTIMNELNRLIIYPRSGSIYQIRYALKHYFGLDKNKIEEIIKSKSRWVCIGKNYPQYVLTQTSCELLS